MPIVAFEPEVHPDFGMSRKFKPKVLMVEFGDGYSQRSSDGLNNNAVMLSPTWTNLTEAEKDYIDGFFRARRGVESFSYQYVDETTPRIYICTEWDYSHSNVGSYTLTATFQQVYDIG